MLRWLLYDQLADLPFGEHFEHRIINRVERLYLKFGHNVSGEIQQSPTRYCLDNLGWVIWLLAHCFDLLGADPLVADSCSS